MKKILIIEALRAFSEEELLKISQNLEKFCNVKVKNKEDLAEAIAETNHIAIENDKVVYLEEPILDNEDKEEIQVIRNETKKTAKIWLGNEWVLVNLDGKNRHITRITAMRLGAKKIGFKNGQMEGVELSDYDEENDVNLYIQERYIKEWSFKAAISKETIREATGSMRVLLAEASKEFLAYRGNGLALSEKETEKKK